MTYFVYLDESDSKGIRFSNFYGGVIIPSTFHNEVVERMARLIEELGLANEEIKWQKVNAYCYEKYIKAVDLAFQLMEEDKMKIRIFFRNNRDVSPHQGRSDTYQLLYYQFIKHGFGFSYANNGAPVRVKLMLDDLPLSPAEKKKFFGFLLGLNGKEYILGEQDISEINSKEHLPLQFMDLILGSMCFKLNRKDKLIDPVTHKRGKRTVLRAKLYKYIYGKICTLLDRKFNPGVSTGISRKDEHWLLPYSHWAFVPYNGTGR